MVNSKWIFVISIVRILVIKLGSFLLGVTKGMGNRAKTLDEKRKVLIRLLRVWGSPQNKDLRLVQLIMNTFPLYHLEDLPFIEALEKDLKPVLEHATDSKNTTTSNEPKTFTTKESAILIKLQGDFQTLQRQVDGLIEWLGSGSDDDRQWLEEYHAQLDT